MSIAPFDPPPIPPTTATRPTSALISTAAALARLGFTTGQPITSMLQVEQAAGLSDTSVRRAMKQLEAAGGVERAAYNKRLWIIRDEATVALASTPMGAAEVARAYEAATGTALEDADTVSPVAPSFASLAAQVEALVQEVVTLRQAVQEGVNRVGAVEAALARAVAEVAELRARLDAAAVAPLPLAPRPASPAEVEPTAEDMGRLRRLILAAGSHGAAAVRIGSTKNAVQKALRRGSVSPRMAANLRALDIVRL